MGEWYGRGGEFGAEAVKESAVGVKCDEFEGCEVRSAGCEVGYNRGFLTMKTERRKYGKGEGHGQSPAGEEQELCNRRSDLALQILAEQQE